MSTEVIRLVDGLVRMRAAWVRALTPVVGHDDAVLLADVVELLVPLSRRHRFAEELAFAESFGTDARVIERLAVEKAWKTVTPMLDAPDSELDEVTKLLPSSTYGRLCRIAAVLRDHAKANAPKDTAK